MYRIHIAKNRPVSLLEEEGFTCPIIRRDFACNVLEKGAMFLQLLRFDPVAKRFARIGIRAFDV